MNIEDLVIKLNSQPHLTRGWEATFLSSITDQISLGIGLTKKQNDVILRILRKHVDILTQITRQDVAHSIENPTYRLSVRHTPPSKQITIVEDATYGKILKVQFPYNDFIIENIKLYRARQRDLSHAVWDTGEKAWYFSLTEKNIEFLSNLAITEHFQVSDDFAEYANQIDQIQNSLEDHVPMLCLENGKPLLKNCARSVPQITTDSVLEAAFQARKYGITTYDTAINNIINSNQVAPVVKDFLLSEYKNPLLVNSAKHDFSSISDIVKYMSPCLVVIPGGSEYEKMKESYWVLRHLGIQAQEMSVMFRLPGETGGNFNNFVKNQGLNSPIEQHTKIVFVSGKLAKPVVKSKIKFHCVINLGYDNAHHTMRDFLKNHENTIYYSNNPKKSGVRRANM